MRIYYARWVLPIVSPPFRDGWVAVDAGRIAAVGGPDRLPPAGAPEPATTIRKNGLAILPGLVNAHCHLELSWMRDQVPPASSMPAWVGRLMALRRSVGHEPRLPIVEALRDARAFGTTLIGDITNTFADYEPLTGSPVAAVVFRELLGFNASDPRRLVADVQDQIAALPQVPGIRVSIVPHAPYSVSPALFEAIAEVSGAAPVAVHVGESMAEIEFLRTGLGPWRDLLERIGAWNPEWRAPGVGPIAYLARFGLVNERLLAVHGVQLTDLELSALRTAGATVVACPRSNRWTGAGTPPVDRFYASGVRVAVGTDSLASVEDLNVFEELASLRALAPEVPARELLRSATLSGAEALGFDAELGSLEPPKRAELLGVRVPDDVEDVEEYLVRGIRQDAIRWICESDGGRTRNPEPNLEP